MCAALFTCALNLAGLVIAGTARLNLRARRGQRVGLEELIQHEIVDFDVLDSGARPAFDPQISDSYLDGAHGRGAPAVPVERRGLVLAGVMASVFLAAMESTVVATAMPTVIASLGGRWTTRIVILPDVRGLHPYYEELALRFAENGVDVWGIDFRWTLVPATESLSLANRTLQYQISERERIDAKGVGQLVHMRLVREVIGGCSKRAVGTLA